MSTRRTSHRRVLPPVEAACEAILHLTNPAPRLIILYGSEARGDSTPESDIDLLVALERTDPQSVEAVRAAAYEAMWHHGFDRLVSTLTLSTESVF